MSIINMCYNVRRETRSQHHFHERVHEAGLSLGKKVETGAVTHITSVFGAAEDIMKSYTC
jgi:hypothetical protein